MLRSSARRDKLAEATRMAAIESLDQRLPQGCGSGVARGHRHPRHRLEDGPVSAQHEQQRHHRDPSGQWKSQQGFNLSPSFLGVKSNPNLNSPGACGGVAGFLVDGTVIRDSIRSSAWFLSIGYCSGAGPLTGVALGVPPVDCLGWDDCLLLPRGLFRGGSEQDFRR